MLLTTVCLWALNFTASKYVITHGISPLAYATPRYAIAAGIFVLLTLGLERSLRMGRRDFAVLAGTAVVLFLNQVGFIYALHFTTASTVALIFGTLPIFTVLIATLSGVERATPQFLLAGAVSIVGVALVIAGAGGTLSTNLKGDALALLAVATWAGLLGHDRADDDAAFAVPHQRVRADAWRRSCSPSRDRNSWPRRTTRARGRCGPTFAFAVVGPLVVTNVLWFTAIDRVGPSRAALFANLQFFLAAVFGVILLSETITPLQVAGGATIGAAILLSRFQRAPAPQPVE